MVNKQKCGYVAIVGVPNAGKSTLVNSIVGLKISIVTPKVQTTRSKLLGIIVKDNTQVLLIDTPGIFSPKRALDEVMVSSAWSAVEDADIVALIVDASSRNFDQDLKIRDRLFAKGIRPILLLNKVDSIKKDRLLEVSQLFAGDHDNFAKVFMISALKHDGLDDLQEYILDNVPAGPWLFNEDDVTNMPLRLMAAEITREKSFMCLHDELPYSLFVETEKWEEKEDGSVRIEQTLFVQRESQRPIVIGHKGAMIKKIGQRAREDISELISSPVHLFLHVKVREKWTENASFCEKNILL